MKKAIIFDVDGVIVDVRESYHLAIKETAQHYLGKEVPLDLIKRIKYERAINNDWDVTLEVIRHMGGDADYDELVDVFTQKYERLKVKEKPLLSRDFFLRLREAGPSLGIVTGRPRRDLDWVLERFNIKDLFEVTVDEDDIPDPSLRKPDPYPLKLCMDRLGCEEALYIGDNTADQKMVSSATEKYGISVGFVHFKRVIDLNLEADYVASSEEDLLSFLLQWASRNREGVRGSRP